MTKKETMQIMLQDVIDQFVVNPKSRGFNKGTCSYNPGNPKISPGCAIGMYLDIETAKKLDKIGDIENVFATRSISLLPDWMINLGEDFLFIIQGFHDRSTNFTETGISILGLDNIKYICKKFDLKLPKINKINMP